MSSESMDKLSIVLKVKLIRPTWQTIYFTKADFGLQEAGSKEGIVAIRCYSAP